MIKRNVFHRSSNHSGSRSSNVLQPFRGMSKLFFILAGCTLLLFLFVGAGSYLHAKLAKSPAHVMRGLAASVSSQFFLDMVAMEVRSIQAEKGKYTFSNRNVSHFLFRFLTNINPMDPKTLLASEIPGLRDEQLVLFRSAIAGGQVPPRDYAPSKHTNSNHDHSNESNGGTNENSADPIDSPSYEETIDLSSLLQVVDNSKWPMSNGANGANPVKTSSFASKRKVFIYHSHSRESYLPELEPGLKFDEAYDAEVNVTLLGKRLAEKLNDHGIGAVSSEKDYPTAIKDYNWNFSYKYSLQTVKEAFASNPDLEYFFDIHRDSQPRDITTVEIDGKTYAQVFFIIGHKNPNWEKNEAFASSIHEKLEAKYPGISRGVWGKQAGNGNNGEYNQSFSPNSVIIEVGGVENTLEEANRTIDVLSGVIAEIVMDAAKVSQPVDDPPQAS